MSSNVIIALCCARDLDKLLLYSTYMYMVIFYISYCTYYMYIANESKEYIFTERTVPPSPLY